MLLKKILWRAGVGSLLMPGYLALMSALFLIYHGSDLWVDFVGYKVSKVDIQEFINLQRYFVASALVGATAGVVYTLLENYVLYRKSRGVTA